MTADASRKPQKSGATLGICHIASGDRWAGAEVQLTALLSALTEFPDLRLSAIFLNEGRAAEEARHRGIDVCVLDETRQGFFETLSGAAAFVTGKHIHVLHSHRYKENLLAGLLARRCNIPLRIATQHGAPELFGGWRSFKQWLIQAFDRGVVLRTADGVVAVSDDLRKQLTRSLPAAKVVTIRNGIDEKSVSSPLSPTEAKQGLGIAPDCPVVGTAGRLEPVKRLDLFLAAAKQIGTDLPSARFLIVGDGSESAQLRQLATALGLSEKVLFLGHRDDVYDTIRAMDVFVICSDHEGLPMALLETLCLGVPVVTRPVGGIPEVVQDGVNALYVRTSDSGGLARECLKLLADQPRRHALALAGADLVARQFTARNSAEQTLALYRSLLKPSSEPSA